VWGPDGVEWRVTPLAFGALLDALGDAEVVAADVPIGLPDPAPRECDLLARAALGSGRSSVFVVPPREVLEAPDYAAACAVARSLTGKAISLQTWHIGARVLDATDTVAARPERRVVEAHPEVSFATLAGGPLPSKLGAAGIGVRIAALAPVFGDVPALLAACPRPARADDALDALACAWTARRVLDGTAAYLGDGPSIAY
jgi:predicted RNase H-like nuclease